MCGIAGIFSIDEINERECIDFIDVIAHRGPDGRGTFFDRSCNLFLGHRRLIILDTTDAGQQPRHSYCGRYVIVFNGEIYNFIELRNELSSKGYSFHSETDTEVVLAAYEEWGEECQLKFNGMWAFAIWDTKERKLFLSRDRFGVKPLYIYAKNGRFAFASEIKAFGALSFIELRLDSQKVADTIEDPLLLEPSSDTIFQDIRKIPAGYSLSIQNLSYPIRLKQWWDTLAHLQKPPGSYPEQVEKFKEIFFDACSIRMRSDVSIGTALSGGLDSSSILCSIFRLGSQAHARWPQSWQKSFTAVFPQSTHDELEYAQLAANQTKASASYFTMSPSDTIENFESTLYSIEDIFDPPIGPWLLYREYRKQGISISIDGHGADELLCGYHHQFERAFLESIVPFPNLGRMHALWPLMKQMYAVNSDQTGSQILKKLLKTAFQAFGGKKDNVVYQALKRAYWGRLSEKEGFGRHGFLKFRPSQVQLAVNQKFENLSFLGKLLYLDFHHRTLPSILRNFDRCSMAHGVEIRAPFMDWRLVTFAFSLPTEAKVGQLGSKQILRDAMEGILPEKIRLRKSKIGFASPLNQWIASDLGAYILDIIHSRQFQESPIWNGPIIAKEAEKLIEQKRGAELRKFWEFILADRLMAVFKSKRLARAV